MLSDLVQYFTVSEDLFIEDYDLVEFIRFIHKHTQDDNQEEVEDDEDPMA